MKSAFYFLMVILLLFVSVGITNTVFFSNEAMAEKVMATNSLEGNSTKATLSNDLKVAIEQTDTGILPVTFFGRNWVALVGIFLACAEGIVRLTPSEADNSIVNFISKLINFLIPNLRKGGGVF